MNDSDGWQHWVDQQTLDTNLYFKREDAQKVIEQKIADSLILLGEAALRNPEFIQSYNKQAEMLKNNMYEFSVGTRDSEELPKYGIKELTVI